jgi:hypothetical protein
MGGEELAWPTGYLKRGHRWGVVVLASIVREALKCGDHIRFTGVRSSSTVGSELTVS